MSRDEGDDFQKLELFYMDTSSSNNKQSRVTDLQLCRPGSPDICLPPTHFDWALGEVGFETATKFTLAAPGLTIIDRAFGDFNGDGCTDVAWVGAAQNGGNIDYYVEYAIGSDTGGMKKGKFRDGTTFLYFPSNPIQIDVVDYNNDGRHDLMLNRGLTQKWKVLLSKLSSNGEWRLNESTSSAGSIQDDEDIVFYDMNGDGLTDAARTHLDTIQGNLLLPDPAEPLSSATPNRYSAMTSWSLPYNPSTATGLIFGSADINGDGLSDFRAKMVWEPIPTNNISDEFVVTGPNQTTSFYPMEGFQEGVMNAPSYTDINQDGLTDIIRYVIPPDGFIGISPFREV